MRELKYKREVLIVLAFSFMIQMFAISMNDIYIFIFFHTLFPLGFIFTAMLKEGRLF